MINAKEARIRTFQNVADDDYLLFKHVEKLVVTAIVKEDFGIVLKPTWWRDSSATSSDDPYTTIKIDGEEIKGIFPKNFDRQKTVMYNSLRDLGYNVLTGFTMSNHIYINW
jgi:tRNA splicing endonuclease